MNRAVTPDLFTPIRLGRLELPNRIVMAPMTRARAGAGGTPGCLNAAYYRQRASAGLIISEATEVSAQGGGFPGCPGIYNFEQIAGWRQVTDTVHDVGGRIFLQLWHVGRVSHPAMQPGGALPVAPSAVAPAGQVFTADGPQDYVAPRALAAEEMPGVIDQFRRAAANAAVAGFDGVEVHGANGYLIDQFLRDGSNRREDEWGGSVDNRARLLLAVVAAACESWGADRVGVRLSPAGSFNDMRDSDPDATFGRVVELLNPLGLCYLHVIEDGDYDVAALRRAWRGHYMANGGYDFARANAALAAGAADLVSFGKLWVSNPDLPRRFELGAPLAAADPATFYTGNSAGYTDYPALEPAGG